MAIELRKTGISVVGEAPWGTHFCHFYETKQDLLDTLVPFFKAGLESKEFCLWVVSNSDLITVEEAKEALAQAVPDLDRHLSEESIEILNGHDWYFEQHALNLERAKHGLDAKLKRALARGYEGLRASADTFWLAEKDRKDFFAYEKQVNEWITNQSMTVMCTYPLAKSGATEVLDVVQAHQFAIARRQGEWEVIETPQMIQAKAEIKKLSEELEQRVIERTNELRVANEELRKEIAERKQAEDALRQSEDRIRLIIDTIPVMAWSLRTDGVFDFLNQRWMDYAGLSLEQYVEEPTRPVHPEDVPRAVEKWLADMVAGEPNEDEIRLRRADGEYRWFLVRNAPLRDEQGNVVKWYGASINIQERKQVEEQLRQSERQLAEAQHLAHIGSWNWDLQSNALNWSDELYRIFGVDPQAFHPAFEDVVMEFVRAEDRALVRGVVESSLKTQEPFSFYYRILRPDGEERVIYSRGDIVSDEHGKPIRMFGVAQDVTERKHAEEALREAERKYRDIFENAGEGIFQSTPDGRYIAANPALARMYGFASPEELIHSRQDISLQVYVDPTRREEFKRQLEEQGAVRGFEHEVFRKDGSRLWISVNARAVQDKQGAIQYYEGTTQDITERKAAEEKLKATSEQLRDLSARLQSAREAEGTRIAREIHDELGAALSSLRWDLEDVDEVISELGERSQLQELRQKIAAMMRLTDTTVNTVRRIASELRPIALDTLGLVEAIQLQAEQFQERTGILVTCDCNRENVDSQPEQSTAVLRIFQEALTNVLRHAQATRVDVSMDEMEGNFVLRISDNGRGITEDEKSGQRTLGLLGMRERAHLVGGEVEISGVVGKGTVVSVRIPISGRVNYPEPRNKKVVTSNEKNPHR